VPARAESETKAVMQNLYYINIHSLANDTARLLGKLNDEQQKKTAAYRQEYDMLRSLAGQLMARHIAGGIPIRYTENGKPYLEGGPFFNIAHSGDYAVAVVSQTAPVGIDLEFTENTRGGNFPALAQKVFHPEELRYFNKNPNRRRFYEIWTQKEAFVKMKGDGLGIGLKTVNILDCFADNRSRRNHPAYIRLFHDLAPYIIAVCSTEPVEIKTVAALQAQSFL
jgi:4'-phosphopantetheinyl transferase